MAEKMKNFPKMNFWNKKNDKREDFAFPDRPFEFDKSKLKSQTQEQLVTLIDKFDLWVKEIEKSFKKHVSIYDEMAKNEEKLQKKMEKMEEKFVMEKKTMDNDMAQLRSGYHKYRQENEQLQKN